MGESPLHGLTHLEISLNVTKQRNIAYTGSYQHEKREGEDERGEGSGNGQGNGDVRIAAEVFVDIVPRALALLREIESIQGECVD